MDGELEANEWARSPGKRTVVWKKCRAGSQQHRNFLVGVPLGDRVMHALAPVPGLHEFEQQFLHREDVSNQGLDLGRGACGWWYVMLLHG
jgi:hypothetical protein